MAHASNRELIPSVSAIRQKLEPVTHFTLVGTSVVLQNDRKILKYT